MNRHRLQSPTGDRRATRVRDPSFPALLEVTMRPQLTYMGATFVTMALIAAHLNAGIILVVTV